ncbi:hypothetical protein [Cohnella boryungensis]|uniref:Polymer-forming cytoskeletal protein n=1 Tax=Cohnella boryungensis TaxID=768479 RepID=A0ABV8S853_9BACL
MENAMKPDLIINGMSAAGGGTYGKVRIDGAGTVEGDISSDTFDSNGMTKIRGSLLTDELDGDGILTVEGNLAAGNSLMDGNMKIRGSLKADSFAVNGVLSVKGDCEIESFRMEGAFDVKGLLNAGTADIKLHGKGNVREIGVESIQVRRKSKSPWGKLLNWMLPRFSSELHAKVIEGDDIDLEYTEADVVRGNRIVIGRGCKIELVEYRTELKAHPSAIIGKEVRTGG